jgi:hypothetical protein
MAGFEVTMYGRIWVTPETIPRNLLLFYEIAHYSAEVRNKFSPVHRHPPSYIDQQYYQVLDSIIGAQ